MSAPSDLIAIIKERVLSGECDLRDVGKLLTGKWDQDAPALLLDHIASLEAENARLVKERDEAKRLFDVQIAGHRLSAKESTTNLIRAKAAEAERDALRAALQTSLVAMKLAAALPGVSDEYDFAPAIEYAARTLSGKGDGE
jgi:hypothetical protein